MLFCIRRAAPSRPISPLVRLTSQRNFLHSLLRVRIGPIMPQLASTERLQRSNVTWVNLEGCFIRGNGFIDATRPLKCQCKIQSGIRMPGHEFASPFEFICRLVELSLNEIECARGVCGWDECISLRPGQSKSIVQTHWDWTSTNTHLVILHTTPGPGRKASCGTLTGSAQRTASSADDSAFRRSSLFLRASTPLR